MFSPLVLSWGIMILNIAVITAIDPLIDDSDAIYPLGPTYRNSLVHHVSYGVRWFSEIFLEDVAKKNPEESLLVSPLGVALSLSMAEAAASDDCKTVISSILVLPEDEMKKRTGYQTVIDQFNSHNPMELHVANGLFGPRDTAVFYPKYIASCKRAFRSSVQYFNSKESAKASIRINEWCESKTHNRIKQIVKEDDINGESSDPAEVDVNTIYFKGTWVKKFAACSEDGCPISYPPRKLETSVPQMWGKHVVRYGEYPEVNANFIELPFVSANHENDMSMFILLPKERHGLTNLEKNLHKIKILTLRDRGDYTTVNILLPKLKIETELGLKEHLDRMNMSSLMDFNAGEFNIIDDESQFYIKEYVQKSFIELNEEGSEAAAATRKVFRHTDEDFYPIENLYRRPDEDIVEYGTVGPFKRVRLPPPYTVVTTITAFGSEADAENADEINFVADHPFYVIVATTNNAPLIVFAGRYVIYG